MIFLFPEDLSDAIYHLLLKDKVSNTSETQKKYFSVLACEIYGVCYFLVQDTEFEKYAQ